jgi:hypothetical protein
VNVEFKPFFSKLAIFFALLVFIDFAVGKTLEYFYFKQESGLQYRTTYALEKTTADLLVFGSSRANHHYVPEIFAKELNMSYYNAGRDGSFILYHYAVLKGVLKRYKPKIIILDLNFHEFDLEKQSYERIACLLPYYRTHPELKPIIELKGKTEKFKLLSSIYPYNSSIFTIAVGNTKKNKERKQDNKGYVPLNGSWTQTLVNSNAKELYLTDSVKVNCYRSFIRDCISARVKLYVAFSPYFGKNYNTDFSVREAKQIAEANGVKVLDFSADTLFLNNPGLFSDIDHLNNGGAYLYSGKIAEEIKTQGSATRSIN